MLTREEQLTEKIIGLMEWANELIDPMVYPDNVWELYRELLGTLKTLRVSYED